MTSESARVASPCGDAFLRARAIWRRGRGLRAEERRFAVTAWLLALPVEVSLGALGLRKTLAWIERVPALGTDGEVSASEGERLVDDAYRLHVARGRCLPRSLVQYLAHRLRGERALFRVGVKREGEGIAAHAWVERDEARAAEFVPIFADDAS